MLRVILDANVLLSYAIATSGQSQTIVKIVDAAVDGVFSLIAPAELLRELERTATTSRYFRARLDQNAFKQFLEMVSVIAEPPQPMTIELERIVRDPNDDYLLAAAHFYEADVLVTGDKDLLVLKDHVIAFRILSPREFLSLIGI